MARYKTKKQKKNSSKKVSRAKVKPSNTVPFSNKKEGSEIALHLSHQAPFSNKKGGSEITISTKLKTQTTIFSNSQVKLLYRDLFKTLVVTLVVFTVLLSIFMYMR